MQDPRARVRSLGRYVVPSLFSLSHRHALTLQNLTLAGSDFMARGAFLPDMVTIIGTMDLVFGEVDR